MWTFLAWQQWFRTLALRSSGNVRWRRRRFGGCQWAIVRRQLLQRTSVASFQWRTRIQTTWQRALGFPCLASMQFGHQLTSRILCVLFLLLFFSFGTAGVWAVKLAGEYFHIHMNVKVALKMFLRPCNNSKRIKNEMNRHKKCDTSLLKFQEKNNTSQYFRICIIFLL